MQGKRPGKSERKSHLNLFTDCGGNGLRVPPVPIPNTEVKPQHADGTWLEMARESRSLPHFHSRSALAGRAFLCFLCLWGKQRGMRGDGVVMCGGGGYPSVSLWLTAPLCGGEPFRVLREGNCPRVSGRDGIPTIRWGIAWNCEEMTAYSFGTKTNVRELPTR